MSTRPIVLVVALAGLAAAAQNEATPPPLIFAPEGPPPPGGCTSGEECGPGGSCNAGLCQPTDAPGASSPALKPLRQRGPNGEERFKYRGTVPAGFHLVSEPRPAMIAGGIGALAGGYSLTLVISLLAQQWGGAVPFVGPVIFAAQVWLPPGRFGEGTLADIFIATLAIVEVAAQVAGVVLMVVGVTSPAKWLERGAEKPAVISLLPGAAGTPFGASVVGRF
ncbi:MAG: hypothetical protein Q8L48_07430 [Archangium sp.]|nr:hypothetical protein [Archangium sp.]